MVKETKINLTDSIAQYGDGLFETILISSCVDNPIYNFDYHKKRIEKGCNSLKIALPNLFELKQRIISKTDQHNNKNPSKYFIAKVIISRGESLRAYRTIKNQPAKVYIQIFPYQFNKLLYSGASIHICNLKLSQQPALAGIKHLNRLEQVLAKQEIDDTSFAEGIMLDTNSNIIECISSNIFIVKDNKITTPKLDSSGVAGTIRSQIIDICKNRNFDIDISNIKLPQVKEADEVFYTNAVVGIVPVLEIAIFDKKYKIHTSKLIANLINHPCLSFYS